jgi:hypothetical protein
MITKKLHKPKYFGVNEIHTYQIVDNTFFVGMNLQGTKKDSTDEFMLMFSVEQIIDMYKFAINKNNHNTTH